MNLPRTQRWAENPPTIGAAEAGLRSGTLRAEGCLPEREGVYARKGADYEAHAAERTQDLSRLEKLARSHRVGTLNAAAKNPLITGELLLEVVQNLARRSAKFGDHIPKAMHTAPDKAVAEVLSWLEPQNYLTLPIRGLAWRGALEATLQGRDAILREANLDDDTVIHVQAEVSFLKGLTGTTPPDATVLNRLHGHIPDSLFADLFGRVLVNQTPGNIIDREIFRKGVDAAEDHGLHSTSHFFAERYIPLKLPDWQSRALLESRVLSAVHTVIGYGEVTPELYEEYELGFLRMAARIHNPLPAPTAAEVIDHEYPLRRLTSMQLLRNMGPVSWSQEECEEVLGMPEFGLLERGWDPHPVETRYASLLLGDDPEVWRLMFSLVDDWEGTFTELVQSASALAEGK